MFPAPAGINRQWSRREFTHDCVPRASGDKPARGSRSRCMLMYSPRQRG
ncbi:hypothetical protein AD10_3225 [Escherichia coli 1-182-04_S4_C2]|nr:hypothetical protein AD39_3241 [Escherichia coli 1-182-04_S4_C3]EZJ39884.1 hypothetical protein AD10_3225 [Escherichia coli 1-182-04_S4_C2]